MDFLSDQSGRHLLRINNTVTVPDYVKQANVDAEAVAELPITCFADQAHNEFPINTPAHAFLSYAYCKSAGIVNPLIVARIKKAGAKLGITGDLEKIDAAFGHKKQASIVNERKFAISIDFEDGNEKQACALKGIQNFYPINDAGEIQTSAIELDNDKGRIPLPLYVQGAREIMKAASAAKMEDRLLPDRIRQYGVEHFPDFDYVNQEAERRVSITGDTVYDDIAKTAAVNAEFKEMDDYAKLWELADARNGITCSRSLPDPYRIFNSGLNKQAYADGLDQHIVLGGAVVPIAAIAQIDTTKVQQRFPKAAAADILELVKSAAKTATDDATVLAASLSGSVQKALLRLIVA
jgi:hypothetical protein